MHLVQLDPKDGKGNEDRQVQLVNVEVMVYQDAQVSVDFLASKAAQVLQAAQEPLDGRVHLVDLALKVLRVIQVCLARLDHRDKLGDQD